MFWESSTPELDPVERSLGLESQSLAVVRQRKGHLSSYSLAFLCDSLQALIDGSFEVEFPAFATYSNRHVIDVDQLFPKMEGHTRDGFFNYTVAELAGIILHGSQFLRAKRGDLISRPSCVEAVAARRCETNRRVGDPIWGIIQLTDHDSRTLQNNVFTSFFQGSTHKTQSIAPGIP